MHISILDRNGMAAAPTETIVIARESIASGAVHRQSDF